MMKAAVFLILTVLLTTTPPFATQTHIGPCIASVRETVIIARTTEPAPPSLRLTADRLITIDRDGGTIDDTGRIVWRGPEMWLGVWQPCGAEPATPGVWHGVWLPIVIK